MNYYFELNIIVYYELEIVFQITYWLDTMLFSWKKLQEDKQKFIFQCNFNTRGNKWKF